jgi:glutathione S-transferase
MALPTLVTISFSHYCDKARWALDRAAIAYREEAYVPVTHLLGTVRRGGRSTPLLALPDGTTLKDSTDILAYVERSRPGLLYPDDPALRREVSELEDLFDEELGPHVRRLAYHSLLTSGRPFAPAIRDTTTGLQRTLAPLLGIVVPRLVKRGLRVDEAGAARSRPHVERVLERVDTLRADGRAFLVGGRFTAADLTFAALYAPLVSPPQHPVTSRVEEAPSYAAMCAGNRTRASGAFAMRMYEQERARVVGEPTSR